MESRLEARITDLLDWVKRRGVPRVTDFLDPREQEQAAALLRQAGGEVGHTFQGGYEGAERKVLVIYPDGGQEQAAGLASEGLAALAVQPVGAGRSRADSPGYPRRVSAEPPQPRWGQTLPVTEWKIKPPDGVAQGIAAPGPGQAAAAASAFSTLARPAGGGYGEAGQPPSGLSHRDYLGAVLGQGIKREKVGDVIVEPGRAIVLVKREVAGYLIGAVASVGPWEVRAELLPLSEVQPPVPRVKEIRGTVASLRLDALAGLAFGTSRGKIMPLIKGERVEVNWRVVTQPAKQLSAGDTISIRGKGRAILAEVAGQSKKGRLVVVIKRYL